MYYGITLEELGAGRAIMVAICGIVVVFIVLAALALIIMLISKGVNLIDSRAAAKAPAAPAQKAAAPAAVAPAAPAQDQDELVAVLMAAIAAETDSSPDSFRITNIQSR